MSVSGVAMCKGDVDPPDPDTHSERIGGYSESIAGVGSSSETPAAGETGVTD